MKLKRVSEWGEMKSVFIKDRPPIERVRPLALGDTSGSQLRATLT